jgi:hypothetical protein
MVDIQLIMLIYTRLHSSMNNLNLFNKYKKEPEQYTQIPFIHMVSIQLMANKTKNLRGQ